jgi:hypothetical protein
MVALLGGGSIAGGVQQIASQPMQLGLVVSLIGSFNDQRSLGEAIQALDLVPEPGVGLGKPHENPWRKLNSPGGAVHSKPVGDQSEAFLCLPKRSQ